MKKILLIALSLCGFAVGTAQAKIIQYNIGDHETVLIHESTFSKGLGEANGKIIASGYGDMKNIRTPIRSEDPLKYTNTGNANPTNLGQKSNTSAEKTVFHEELDRWANRFLLKIVKCAYWTFNYFLF